MAKEAFAESLLRWPSSTRDRPRMVAEERTNISILVQAAEFTLPLTRCFISWLKFLKWTPGAATQASPPPGKLSPLVFASLTRVNVRPPPRQPRQEKHVLLRRGQKGTRFKV